MILDSYESPIRGLSYAVPFVSKFGVFYDKYENFRVRGQSSPHRAKQRLSAGRARDHPVMEIVPNKALSLSQGGPNRRAAMAEHGPMEKQEVRQVCSDRHETCTLIF